MVWVRIRIDLGLGYFSRSQASYTSQACGYLIMYVNRFTHKKVYTKIFTSLFSLTFFATFYSNTCLLSLGGEQNECKILDQHSTNFLNINFWKALISVLCNSFRSFKLIWQWQDSLKQTYCTVWAWEYELPCVYYYCSLHWSVLCQQMTFPRLHYVISPLVRSDSR